MNEEIKKAIEGIRSAFELFKKDNDKAVSMLATKGHVDSLLKEKVERINAAISEGQGKLQAKLDELELKLNRVDLLGGQDGADAKEFKKELESFGRLIGAESLPAPEALVEYKKGMNHYLRFGANGFNPDMRATMSVGSEPEGGYWVTPDRSGRIIKFVYETSPMRQVASVMSIGTDALEGLYDLDEGVSGGWVAELQARGETGTPKIGSYRIPVHEQFAQPRTTQKVLDDANVDVGAWLEGKTSDILSRTENTAFLLGDGAGKPRGMLTYPHGIPLGTSPQAFKVVERTATGAAGAFAASDPGDSLIDLIFSLKAIYRTRARFMMARKTVGETRKLKDGQGNYLWQPDFQQTAAGRLLGFGITEAEDMPQIAANSLSISFGDHKQAYQIVDRQGIRVLRDPFTNKGSVLFYTTKRVGGDITNFDALKLLRFAVAVT